MTYPTLDEVNAANRSQICCWVRFLKSPGAEAVGRADFHQVLDAEAAIMDLICKRLQELGGFTPEISKQIGWER